MKKFLHLKMCLILGLFFPLAIAAQGVITGTITEASTNAPLPGANVEALLFLIFLVLK